MFLDNELSTATGVAIDLGPKNPGPGKPIKCIAMGVSAEVTITDGVTAGAATFPLMVVTCGGADLVEFELPSSTRQFVEFAYVDGQVEIVLEGNQTNQ